MILMNSLKFKMIKILFKFLKNRFISKINWIIKKFLFKTNSNYLNQIK